MLEGVSPGQIRMYAVAHLLVVIAVEFNQSVRAGRLILIHFPPIVEVHGCIGRNEGVSVRVGVLAPYLSVLRFKL